MDDDNGRKPMLFNVMRVVLGVTLAMARHGNRGFGFGSQGTRGANAGGHRKGCI